MSDQTAERERTRIHVFVNRKKVKLDTATVTGAELLRDAGFEGTNWDLLQLKGEEDPTGGKLILADEVLHLKDGERFRVIPGDRTFGGTLGGA